MTPHYIDLDVNLLRLYVKDNGPKNPPPGCNLGTLLPYPSGHFFKKKSAECSIVVLDLDHLGTFVTMTWYTFLSCRKIWEDFLSLLNQLNKLYKYISTRLHIFNKLLEKDIQSTRIQQGKALSKFPSSPFSLHKSVLTLQINLG